MERERGKRQMRLVWACIAGCAAAFMIASAALAVLPAPSAQARAKAVARSLQVRQVSHRIPSGTVTVHDASRPAGAVIRKGADGRRVDTYLVVRSNGRRTKVDSRITVQPSPRIVTAADPGAATPAPDIGAGAAPQTQGQAQEQAQGQAQGQQPQRGRAPADYATFIGFLRSNGIGAMDGAPVTWADVSVLGVDDAAMASGGVRGDQPLVRDEQGVWHAADGAIAVGGPAACAIGTRMETAVGTLLVVDHDRSGTWNIMTDWRHLPAASSDPASWVGKAVQ